MEPDKEHRNRRTDHLEQQHLGRHAVVEARDAYRLLVDHRVEAVFAKPWRTRRRIRSDGSPSHSPELTLQSRPLLDRSVGGVAAWYFVGQLQLDIGVVHQQ